MTTINDIGWDYYKDYEGAKFIGKQPYVLPKNPDDADKILAVIASCEGGHYDAINMYDRGIVSVGLIQWIEAGQFSVSSMLGEVAESMGVDAVLTPLKPALDMCDVTFKKDANGLWRFFFNKGPNGGPEEVDTLAESRALFLGCSGLKGSWTPATKLRAKTWAACLSNVWQTEEARHAQNTYTRKRLMGFVFPEAKATLFGSEPNVGWYAALRAIYISFAVNLPSVANNQLKIAVANLKSPKWSPEWCVGVIKQLTLGPNISIYGARYNAFRPVVESLWGVKLPRSVKDLLTWQEPKNVPPPPPPQPAPEPPVPAPPVVPTTETQKEVVDTQPPTDNSETVVNVEPQQEENKLEKVPEQVEQMMKLPLPAFPTGTFSVLKILLWLVQVVYVIFQNRKNAG